MVSETFNNPSNKNQSKSSSTFIMIMMVIFVFGNVFRKMYDDQPVFKIGRKKYSVSFCKKYIAYIDDNSLLREEKFRRHFYEILRIAQKKAALSSLCYSLGLKVSDQDLKESILNDYSFLKNGTFSREKFLQKLKVLGVSENEFYELRREELMHQQFWYLLKNSYSISSDLARRFNQAYFAKRKIRFAKVNHSDIKLKYSKKDLINFYSSVKDYFKTPRSYKYEGIVVSIKNFSNEDLVFLDRVVKNNNFDSITKNYKNDAKRLSHDDLVEKFGRGLVSYNYGRDLEVGDCFGIPINDFFYVIKVVSVEESKILPFSDVKERVKVLYERKNKPLKINQNELKWSSFSFSADDFYTLSLPYNFAKKAFSLPIGEVVALHEGDVSYFLILDSISYDRVYEDSSDILLRGYLDAEISRCIELYLLDFISEV